LSQKKCEKTKMLLHYKELDTKWTGEIRFHLIGVVDPKQSTIDESIVARVLLVPQFHLFFKQNCEKCLSLRVNLKNRAT
jgi:hypothetical protein